MRSSGVVADEKFSPTTSMSGKALRALNNVMVLPGVKNTALAT